MPKVWETEKTSKQTVVICNGQSVLMDPTEPFASSIKNVAGGRGLAKFTVIADGREITTHNVPETFDGLKEVLIKKYDEAA